MRTSEVEVRRTTPALEGAAWSSAEQGCDELPENPKTPTTILHDSPMLRNWRMSTAISSLLIQKRSSTRLPGAILRRFL